MSNPNVIASLFLKNAQQNLEQSRKLKQLVNADPLSHQGLSTSNQLIPLETHISDQDFLTANSKDQSMEDYADELEYKLISTNLFNETMANELVASDLLSDDEIRAAVLHWDIVLVDLNKLRRSVKGLKFYRIADQIRATLTKNHLILSSAVASNVDSPDPSNPRQRYYRPNNGGNWSSVPPPQMWETRTAPQTATTQALNMGENYPNGTDLLDVDPQYQQIIAASIPTASSVPAASLSAPSAPTSLAAAPAPTSLAAPPAPTSLAAPPAPTSLAAPPAPTLTTRPALTAAPPPAPVVQEEEQVAEYIRVFLESSHSRFDMLADIFLRMIPNNGNLTNQDLINPQVIRANQQSFKDILALIRQEQVMQQFLQIDAMIQMSQYYALYYNRGNIIALVRQFLSGDKTTYVEMLRDWAQQQHVLYYEEFLQHDGEVVNVRTSLATGEALLYVFLYHVSRQTQTNAVATQIQVPQQNAPYEGQSNMPFDAPAESKQDDVTYMNPPAPFVQDLTSDDMEVIKQLKREGLVMDDETIKKIKLFDMKLRGISSSKKKRERYMRLKQELKQRQFQFMSDLKNENDVEEVDNFDDQGAAEYKEDDEGPLDSAEYKDDYEGPLDSAEYKDDYEGPLDSAEYKDDDYEAMNEVEPDPLVPRTRVNDKNIYNRLHSKSLKFKDEKRPTDRFEYIKTANGTIYRVPKRRKPVKRNVDEDVEEVDDFMDEDEDVQPDQGYNQMIQPKAEYKDDGDGEMEEEDFQENQGYEPWYRSEPVISHPNTKNSARKKKSDKKGKARRNVSTDVLDEDDDVADDATVEYPGDDDDQTVEYTGEDDDVEYVPPPPPVIHDLTEMPRVKNEMPRVKTEKPRVKNEPAVKKEPKKNKSTKPEVHDLTAADEKKHVKKEKTHQVETAEFKPSAEYDDEVQYFEPPPKEYYVHDLTHEENKDEEEETPIKSRVNKKVKKTKKERDQKVKKLRNVSEVMEDDDVEILPPPPRVVHDLEDEEEKSDKPHDKRVPKKRVLKKKKKKPLYDKEVLKKRDRLRKNPEKYGVEVKREVLQKMEPEAYTTKPTTIAVKREMLSNHDPEAYQTGMGLDMKKSHHIVNQFKINLHALKQNTLIVLYARNSKRVNAFPPQAISPSLQSYILSMLKTGDADITEFQHLNKHDQITAKAVAEKILHIKPAFNKLSWREDFDVLRGEYCSGNDSLELKQKLRREILFGRRSGLLHRRVADDMLAELY